MFAWLCAQANRPLKKTKARSRRSLQRNTIMKQPHTSQHNTLAGVHAPPSLCPLCDGLLMRIPRRPIDRFTSIFGEHHRFRCERFSCQWEGNLRADGTAEAGTEHSAH